MGEPGDVCLFENGRDFVGHAAKNLNQSCVDTSGNSMQMFRWDGIVALPPSLLARAGILLPWDADEGAR